MFTQLTIQAFKKVNSNHSDECFDSNPENIYYAFYSNKKKSLYTLVGFHEKKKNQKLKEKEKYQNI